MAGFRARLFGSKEFLSHISPSWDKRFVALDHPGMRFERRPLPLGVIYVLGDRDAKLSAASIIELEGSCALVNLVANTYVNYLLDSEMRQHEFSVLSRLLANIPVRLVRPPADPVPSRFVRSNRDRREETDAVSSVSAHSEMS